MTSKENEKMNNSKHDERRSIHPKDAVKEVYEVLSGGVSARQVLFGSKYQKEREKFIGAVFCFTIRNYQGREVFLRQPAMDPPDFELLMPTDRPTKEKPFDVAKVELVTFPAHFDDRLKKELRERAKQIVLEKMRPTLQVPSSTTLLIFLNTTHQRTAFFGVSDAISGTAKNPYMAIWVLRLVDQEDKEMTFAATQVHPELSGDIRIKLSEEIRKGVVYNHPLLGKYARPIDSIPKDA